MTETTTTQTDQPTKVTQDDERACELCVAWARTEQETVNEGHEIYGYNTCECQPTVCRPHQPMVTQRFTCPFCGR